MNNLSYRRATLSNLPQVLELLTVAQLPLPGVEEHLDRFILAFRNDSLAGCAALEVYGESALLRSVAVIESERGTGLGQEMVRRLLDEAFNDGLKTIALLTTTAARFFPRFGFHEINRSDAPASVQVSVEFQGACPNSATVMLLELKRPPILVRPAKESDIPAITEIYNQGILDRATFETRLRTTDEQREWLLNRQPRHPVIVAVQQNEVAGWAALNSFNPREAYRFVADLSIYVERERRGSGIGSALMNGLIERGRALDYHKLVLTAFHHSVAAIRLYEKFGFRTVGDYREQGLLAGRWADTKIMELLL